MSAATLDRQLPRLLALARHGWWNEAPDLGVLRAALVWVPVAERRPMFARAIAWTRARLNGSGQEWGTEWHEVHLWASGACDALDIP